MGILLRNWHLKLSAVLLATVLYTGLVFSGSFSESSVQLTVGIAEQPAGTVVLSGTPGTVRVTYRAASDATPALSSESFIATVDLSEYDMERAPDPQVLPIEVRSVVEGVQVIETDPASVTVELDRRDEKTIPVEVEPGEVPEELEIDEPRVSADTVQVRGAASLIARVDHAVARVLIDASGIDVEQSVTLEAVDIDGQPVEGVELDPQSVGVEINVDTVETNTTVPVRPDIEPGTPAAGFALESLSIEPSTVTVRGQPEVLADIAEILTEPLSIDGVSSDQTFEAQLILPDGVRMADGSEPVATVTATIVPSVSSRTFVVGLTCVNSGSNACLPALDQVSVTLSGPGEVLAELSAGELTPTLDAAGLGPGTYNLQPALGGLPEGVELIAINPGSVAVTIRAPATPEPTPAG